MIVVVLLLFPTLIGHLDPRAACSATSCTRRRDRHAGSELLTLERLQTAAMHRHDASTEVLTQAVVRYAVDRVRLDPPPLDGPRTPAELRAMAGKTITAKGLGGLEALRVFGDVLAPACISVDHPRFLSFVPAAPTEASILFDLVVGASSIYAGSWMEGGGAVFAENEALRWIADLAGMPSSRAACSSAEGRPAISAHWWRRDGGGATTPAAATIARVVWWSPRRAPIRRSPRQPA